MKGGIPFVYWAFRNAWTTLHFVIVVAAAALLISWSLTNDNAGHLLGSAKENLLALQQRVASAVPYPWRT
jgi:hypothetical protein